MTKEVCIKVKGDYYRVYRNVKNAKTAKKFLKYTPSTTQMPSNLNF